MQTQGKAAYFTLAGGLIGVGIITIFSIGLAIVLLGVFLALYGRARMGPRLSWLALVGMGAAPLIFLLYDLLVLDGALIADPAAYLYGGLFFLGITLAGVAWGIIDERRSHSMAG